MARLCLLCRFTVTKERTRVVEPDIRVELKFIIYPVTRTYRATARTSRNYLKDFLIIRFVVRDD